MFEFVVEGFLLSLLIIIRIFVFGIFCTFFVPMFISMFLCLSSFVEVLCLSSLFKVSIF